MFRKKKNALVKDTETMDIYALLRQVGRYRSLPRHLKAQLILMERAVQNECLRLKSATEKGIDIILEPIDQEGYRVSSTEYLEPPNLFKPTKINFYELE